MNKKFLFNISNKLNKNIFNVFIAEILTFVILTLFLYSSASSVEASKRNVQKISISTVAAKINGKDIISPCENNASAAIKELEEKKAQELKEKQEAERKQKEQQRVVASIPSGNSRDAFTQICSELGVSEEDAAKWAYIITKESGWNTTAKNPSGAYGLGQALPASKMASFGSDYATNPKTQLKWMYNYMTSRYGSISGAHNFWNSHHWY